MTEQPLRVLCVTRAYGASQGGMERLSYEFTTELQKQPGVSVELMAYTGSRSGLPLWWFLNIWRAVWKARAVDVVHLGDPSLAVYGWLLWHKPVAVTVHGLDVLYTNPLFKLYLYLFFRHLTAYWPISQYANTVLQEKWHPTGVATVLTPGIYDQLYNPTYTRGALNQVLGRDLAEDERVFLTTGRLIKRKGVAWFIAEVLSQLPQEVVYVVVGAGKEFNTIVDAIHQKNLVDRVLVLGRVSNEELQVLYNTVDAFIQPNIQVANDGEGFGLVLLEAALCERPVFAANIEGIPDAITDQQSGTLLPSGDAQVWVQTLQRFLNASTTWQPTGNSARQYVLNTFNWSHHINQYVQALHQISQASTSSEPK